MACPKRQDARREELLRAARTAILLRGLQSTRVRDVADQAGVATGTVTSYFREIDDLFDLVFAEAVERFCTVRERDAVASDDPREQPAAVPRSGLPAGPDDELCCLLYEFSPQARQRPSDARLRRELYGRQVDLYVRVLTAGARSGRFRLRSPAAEIAANLVALEDAYGYHVIARTFMTRQKAERHLFGYAALATDDASLLTLPLIRGGGQFRPRLLLTWLFHPDASGPAAGPSGARVYLRAVASAGPGRHLGQVGAGQVS